METTNVLVGRAVVCDVHETVFGNYVQVCFDEPTMERAPMPWLSVGKQCFHAGEVIVAKSETTPQCLVSRIVYYRDFFGQLIKIGPCRIAKLNPLGM